MRIERIEKGRIKERIGRERRKEEERIEWREEKGWKRNEGRVTEMNRKRGT